MRRWVSLRVSKRTQRKSFWGSDGGFGPSVIELVGVGLKGLLSPALSSKPDFLGTGIGEGEGTGPCSLIISPNQRSGHSITVTPGGSRYSVSPATRICWRVSNRYKSK